MVGGQIDGEQMGVGVLADGEEGEVGDVVEAEVEVLEPSQAHQGVALHPRDPVVEQEQLLEARQLQEVVPAHHLQLVGREVQVAQGTGVLEGPGAELRDQVVSQTQPGQPGEAVEGAHPEPRQPVVAEFQGPGGGRNRKRQFFQGQISAAHNVRGTQAPSRTDTLRHLNQKGYNDYAQHRAHDDELGFTDCT